MFTNKAFYNTSSCLLGVFSVVLLLWLYFIFSFLQLLLRAISFDLRKWGKLKGNLNLFNTIDTPRITSRFKRKEVNSLDKNENKDNPWIPFYVTSYFYKVLSTLWNFRNGQRQLTFRLVLLSSVYQSELGSLKHIQIIIFLWEEVWLCISTAGLQKLEK